MSQRVGQTYTFKLAQAALVDKHWPTPISVSDSLFDFESAMASSIEREELFGYLDSGEIGSGGLFSDSPLTTPEPMPPPSPTLDDHNSTPEPFTPHFILDPQPAPGETASTFAGRLPMGEVEGTGKKYGSNKRRSHAKQKRERAEQRKEREATVGPYEVWPATCQKDIHNSKAVDTALDLAGVPISAPGYIGLRDTEELKDKAAYKLDDLVGESSCFKFKLQKWDGR